MSIGLGVCDRRRGDHGSAAGPVLDDHRLAELPFGLGEKSPGSPGRRHCRP